jgi:hypothetical protein
MIYAIVFREAVNFCVDMKKLRLVSLFCFTDRKSYKKLKTYTYFLPTKNQNQKHCKWIAVQEELTSVH